MKDIPGYEGKYAITEDGRVWSYPRNYGTGGFYEGKFLNPIKDKDGYFYVTLCDGNKRNFRINRLVGGAYIENPFNKPIVNHINGNKQDNRVENLEWYTESENAVHSCHVLGNKKSHEFMIKMGKLGKEAKSRAVMQLTKEGILCKIYPSALEAERQTGIYGSNIRKYITGLRKHAGGYLWQYVN